MFAAVMDLKKAYEGVDRKGLWNVLRIYGMKEDLLDRVWYTCKDECVPLRPRMGEEGCVCFQQHRPQTEHHLLVEFKLQVVNFFIIKELCTNFL